MSKISFTGYIKSRWLSILILLANRNQNAYPSLQAGATFPVRSLKGPIEQQLVIHSSSQLLLCFGENQEKQKNIASVLIFAPAQRQMANLVTSKLPWTYKLWPFHIYKPVMYFGISSETLWCPPCHPPLPLPLSPLLCPLEKYWSFL